MCRVHAKPLANNEAEMILSRDGPIKEWIICSVCREDQIAPDTWDKNPKCLGCGRFLVYRPWFEW